jgi:hypothetical protein
VEEDVMRRVSHWAALALAGLLGAWAVLVIVSGSIPRLGVQSATAEAPASSGEAGSAAGRPVCDGDGRSGDRVQPVYVRAESGRDRYARQLPRFTEMLSRADATITAVAGQHVRFVHGADCSPSVAHVVVPDGVLTDLGRLTDALRGLGYGRPDRTYVLWHEGAGCAVTQGSYAAIGTSCWTAKSTAEQLRRLAKSAYLVA